MGIDIYARWVGQTPGEKEAQITGFDPTAGHVGYLRESYRGELFATHYLVAEAFECRQGAQIPAATLRQRLPETLRLAELRERNAYKVPVKKKIDRILNSYTAFVELCERKERETGCPVTIFASG